MNRREVIMAAGATAAGLAMGSVADAQVLKRSRGRSTRGLNFNNANFYDKDGKFLEEKAKDAVVSVMKYFGYPVYPNIREKLWVSDYGTGQFTTLGLAAVGWANKDDDAAACYMLQDLFLLPNQMLPEHWHEDPKGELPAKDEGWFVRHGSSYIVGIGEANLPKEVVVPECHWNGKVTVENCVLAKPGDFVPLAKVGSHHWQFAGPQGAIITEVANVHVNAAVRHQDPKINKHFLG